MKKKLAVVIQRYGLEVNGGSELLCRQLCERLKKVFDVTVLTTRALDYYSWKNHYPAGVETIRGVRVHRFPADFERDKKSFDALSELVYSTPDDVAAGEQWMKAQGPYASQLFSHIEEMEDHYDFFLFFTYLYATTYFGMSRIKKKKKIILLPTAHDEPPIYLKVFESVFLSPSRLIFNTRAEREFTYRRFHNENIKNIIAGIGIEFPPKYQRHDEAFKQKHALDRYVLYAGRIDESKGCKEMFEHFLRYKKSKPSDVQLVLVGKAEMDIPSHLDIVHLGFVSDQEKFDAIFGSMFMIVPSPYESLSISLLESFLCKRAVLVNGKSEVLKNHCLQSNGGLWYNNASEFIEGFDYLLEKEVERKILGANGHEYVLRNYRWDIVIDTIKRFVLSKSSA